MTRDVFEALADPTRRQILVSLLQERQKINTLALQFEITRQAVSLHVKFLEECGVIIIEQEGRERYCKLEADKLSEAAEWLEPFRTLWNDRLDRLDMLLHKLKHKPKRKRHGKHRRHT